MQIKQMIALRKAELQDMKEQIERVSNIDKETFKSVIEHIAFKQEEIEELEKLVELENK